MPDGMLQTYNNARKLLLPRLSNTVATRTLVRCSRIARSHSR